MYALIDGTLAISVNQWCEAGLSYNQFRMDSQRGFLTIFQRSTNGNTLIDVRSIRRPDRLLKIEQKFGKIEKEEKTGIFRVDANDKSAEDFFIRQRKPDGSPLDAEQIRKYTNRALIFEAIQRGMSIQAVALAKAGKKMKMGEFWELAKDWYLEQMITYPCDPIGNARAFERTFKCFLKDGYKSIIHANLGNDAARLVSAGAERLFVAIYRMNDKPFISRVHELYLEFVTGVTELFDRESGEVFHPEDFRYKGRAIEVSEATIRNYLKDVLNETAVYADRNGNFDYANKKRPKHNRHAGRFSLSKISMDDVALSRKSVRGWVYKYIAVDVVSGYIFRPAYVVGKPTIATVVESFRNMFCELQEMGLPSPGECEVEYHLMKDIEWLNEVFPFVRFCSSPTEKRVEHTNRQFKYGVSKSEGHTRGRWYAKHEAYRSVRNKVDGDYVDPVEQPQTIVADDLADIEKYNNELHPLQKTYPGMTRRQVLIAQANPKLRRIEPWHLYRFIGNETATSIYNNDYCPVQGEQYELADYGALKRLKPNSVEVTAYWLPDETGAIDKVYLYQGDTYIGEAINRRQFAYNECAVERSEEDEAKMLHQNKRIAKFDKMIRERRDEIPKLGKISAAASAVIATAPVEIVETVQPEGYEEDEFSVYENVDYAAMAREHM